MKKIKMSRPILEAPDFWLLLLAAVMEEAVFPDPDPLPSDPLEPLPFDPLPLDPLDPLASDPRDVTVNVEVLVVYSNVLNKKKGKGKTY